MKIVECSISAMPKDVFDPPPVVSAVLEDGSKVRLFEYYQNEISFTEDELIGLTVEEARALRHKKDVDYLQS